MKISNMNRLSILFILVILLSGCLDVKKEQVYRSPDNSTLTLYPDYTFKVHYMDTGNTWAGKYKIDGNTYELTFDAMGLVRTFTADGTKLIEENGDLWQMQ